jgi:hypothetical protein
MRTGREGDSVKDTRLDRDDSRLDRLGVRGTEPRGALAGAHRVGRAWLSRPVGSLGPGDRLGVHHPK